MVWEFKMPFELNSMENLDFRIQRLVLMFTKKNENNNQYKVDIIQLYQISIYKQEVNRETLCHNPFLGHSQIHFLFFQKKKRYGAVLNGNVHILLPSETGEKKIFENFSRYSSPLSFPSHLHKTHTYKSMPP